MESRTDISALIQRVRGNDPEFRDFDCRALNDCGFSVFRTEIRDLVEALRINHTITTANMIHRYLKDLRQEEQFELYDAVGSLPNLCELRHASSGLARLPLNLLNAAISKPKERRLKSIHLQSIHFKDNVFFKTSGSSNKTDKEFVTFLNIVRRDLKDSLETFKVQTVEDCFDLDALVNVLIGCPNLKELVIQSHTLMSQRLTEQSVIKLFASKSIQTLALQRLRLGHILHDPLLSLEMNTTIKSLSLEQNEMTFECGMALAYLLTSNETLIELNLGYNSIPDDCGAALAAALSNNQTLKSLDLTANSLELYTSRRLAHLLANDGSALNKLTLSQNKLLDEGVAMIAAGLERNSKLKEISLAETKMTDASCNVIVAALHTNTTLERLNLSGNKVRDAGCKALSAALETNSTLTSINLSGNELHDDSVLRLVEMLKRNKTLERVNLGNNPSMTKTSYHALERMLIDDNFTIKHLWLPSTAAIVIPDSVTPTFIRLNRLGRRRLLDELDNSTLWLQTIQASLPDLNGIYYLVRSNPTVVSWMNHL